MLLLNLPNIRKSITLSHTTHIISSLDFKVSFITPLFSPRIFNNIIIHSILSTIPNSNNSMINIFWPILTNITSINTTSIVFKTINDLKSNRNRPISTNGLLKTLLIISSNIETTMSETDSSALSISTRSIFSEIRIIFFSCQFIILNILECMRRQTTIASMIIKGLCAVYQLLFTEVQFCFFVYQIMSLHRTDSRKSPTRPTMTLIFHRRNTILFSPIYLIWNILVIKRQLVCGRAILISGFLQKEISELLIR